jgi:hypothetical protein
MAQGNSERSRLYTRFIVVLKAIQYLCYFVVVAFSFIGFFVIGIPFIVILLQAIAVCLSFYVPTQSLIAIIDLLSRIERNTRRE